MTPEKDVQHYHYSCYKFSLPPTHRYRPVEAGDWIELPPVNKTSVVMDNLQPGERYLIEVRSISHNVKSFTSEEVRHTVRK